MSYFCSVLEKWSIFFYFWVFLIFINNCSVRGMQSARPLTSGLLTSRKPRRSLSWVQGCCLPFHPHLGGPSARFRPVSKELSPTNHFNSPGPRVLNWQNLWTVWNCMQVRACLGLVGACTFVGRWSVP